MPDELKARHPSIEWREMAAAGNIYRHDCGSVAAQRIWFTLDHSLPLLRRVIEAELALTDTDP